MADGRTKYRPKYAAKECVYPALRDWMNWNCYNYSDIARMTGLANQTIARALSGRMGTSKYTIDQILKVTGLTYEAAFAAEKEDEHEDV